MRTDIDGSHYAGSGYSGVIDAAQLCAHLNRRIDEERLAYAKENGIDASNAVAKIGVAGELTNQTENRAQCYR